MKNESVIIWLDDERNPFDKIWSKYISDRIGGASSIVWAKNRSQFEDEFLKHIDSIKAVFFDNDLGSLEKGQEGKDCFSWMETHIRENDLKSSFFDIFIQSSNGSAKQSMMLGIESLYKYWFR